MVIDSFKYNGLCSCTKEHKMLTEVCVIEKGSLKNLSLYLEKYNLRGFTVAVYDKNTYNATADRHPKVDLEIILDPDNLHANERAVDEVMKQLPKQTQLLLAIGSGTIHDITRYCAHQVGVPFVSCPTAASVDGFCSSVAAMTWHGCKKTLPAVSPKIVIADIDIIKNAPIRLAKSGFGDMIGKYISLIDWKIANILTGEFYCDRIVEMTLKVTEGVLDLADGIINGNEQAIEKLMGGLLLSGLAMQMMGNSRPASASEHHISHIIEMEPKSLCVHSDALHGEKVGVGTLLVLKEYERLATLNSPNFIDYVPPTKEDIISFFGEEMSTELFEENINDWQNFITAENLKMNWNKVVAEIAKLPNYNQLKKLYEDLGIKSCLSDIDVCEQKTEILLKYAPMVRNRLTLLRIANCII